MAGVAERGRTAREAWEAHLAAWAAAHPDAAAERARDLEGRPRDGWLDALPAFAAGEEIATRDAGKAVMQALKRFTPTLIGGAADLVESTKTEFEGGGVFARSHAGRNVPFGIREHGMGSIVNGIVLEPAMLKPYGSTFLVFSDYMRPAVRLSALSGLDVMWIWTHDSIGLGEDGPTHQPVEHLMALRAIPNLWVVRPGDANETVGAWRLALERHGGPVAFALSRQKLAVLGGDGLADTREGPLRGGYVLWQRDPSAAPEAIVLATGSELGIALEGARSLDANARVVSLPCWELFEEQPESYRDEVLPPSVTARVSIEAGVTFGWERWVGPAGASIGVDRFGASAPAERIYAELGITAEAVAGAVGRVLG
jgi:transketolase